MSLIICSNRGDAQNRGGSIYKPYSFKNALNTPLVIEPNSEIALQSLKVEKDGLFTLNRQSNRFFQYFGKKLTDSFTYDKSPRHPALSWIRIGGADTDEFKAFDTDSLADSIEESMNLALYHPDIQGLANCSVNRTAGAFEGYNLRYDKAESASGTSDIPNVENAFIAAHLNCSFDWVNGHNRFRSNSSGRRAYGIGSAFKPLSCCEGRFDARFTAAINNGWSIGLSRYCDANASYIYDGEVVDKSVTTFDYNNNHAAPTYCRKLDQSKFFDFVAKSVYNNASNIRELRLYHAVCDNTGDDLIGMREVKYYGNYTGAYSQLPYDLTNNASAATGVRFKIDGDEVSLILMKGTAELVTLCSPSLTDVGKENHFKPISMTCSYLYPKLELIDQGDYIDILKWEGRTISGHTFNGINTTRSTSLPINKRQINMDWWATLVWLGTAERYCKDIDTRVYNAIDDAETYTFQKTSGGKIPYDFVLITAESEDYYPTKFCNAQKTLGFDGRGVADTPDDQSGSAVTFTSNVTPKLKSTNSLFVRVNNLTHNSMNAATGNISKIIYHSPRFDSAGNETGALFFEPGERVYIKLNNPSTLTINSFDIDLVNENETYATGVL